LVAVAHGDGAFAHVGFEQICPRKVGPPHRSAAQIGAAQARVAEDRVLEVGAEEAGGVEPGAAEHRPHAEGPAEVGVAEVAAAEVEAADVAEGENRASAAWLGRPQHVVPRADGVGVRLAEPAVVYGTAGGGHGCRAPGAVSQPP
jgi:hypothetical protein